MNVSCIIAVRDGERYLGQALDSVAAQSCPPSEVIVVDDGSTDGSAAIAAAHPVTSRMVTLGGGGQSAARNAGLAVAAGELVAFLDADDLWRPSKLERQLARFQARPELDGSLTAFVNFLDPMVAATGAGWPAHALGPDLTTRTMTTMLGRRDLFEGLGGFREGCLNWASAADWFLRAKAAGAEIEHLPEPLQDRRLHDRNLSRSISRAAWMDSLFQVLASNRPGQPAPGLGGSGRA